MKAVSSVFSYEHFYVIYCTFWEMDGDHDGLIDKEDILRYQEHTLSRLATQRIFDEIPRKFTSGHPGRMCYEDYLYFLLCDQDRNTERSIRYWFSVLDLDCDGYIRGWELQQFFAEQSQRMEYLNYERIQFSDLICQMRDMVGPQTEELIESLDSESDQFCPIGMPKRGDPVLKELYSLGDFLRHRKAASSFFQIFVSLHRLLSFEHRDPFQVQQQQLEAPNATDWDRWCHSEYQRLAEEEEDDGGGVGGGGGNGNSG